MAKVENKKYVVNNSEQIAEYLVKFVESIIPTGRVKLLEDISEQEKSLIRDKMFIASNLRHNLISQFSFVETGELEPKFFYRFEKCMKNLGLTNALKLLTLGRESAVQKNNSKTLELSSMVKSLEGSYAGYIFTKDATDETVKYSLVEGVSKVDSAQVQIIVEAINARAFKRGKEYEAELSSYYNQLDVEDIGVEKYKISTVKEDTCVWDYIKTQLMNIAVLKNKTDTMSAEDIAMSCKQIENEMKKLGVLDIANMVYSQVSTQYSIDCLKKLKIEMEEVLPERAVDNKSKVFAEINNNITGLARKVDDTERKADKMVSKIREDKFLRRKQELNLDPMRYVDNSKSTVDLLPGIFDMIYSREQYNTKDVFEVELPENLKDSFVETVEENNNITGDDDNNTNDSPEFVPQVENYDESLNNEEDNHNHEDEEVQNDAEFEHEDNSAEELQNDEDTHDMEEVNAEPVNEDLIDEVTPSVLNQIAREADVLPDETDDVDEQPSEEDETPKEEIVKRAPRKAPSAPKKPSSATKTLTSKSSTSKASGAKTAATKPAKKTTAKKTTTKKTTTKKASGDMLSSDDLFAALESITNRD